MILPHNWEWPRQDPFPLVIWVLTCIYGTWWSWCGGLSVAQNTVFIFCSDLPSTGVRIRVLSAYGKEYDVSALWTSPTRWMKPWSKALWNILVRMSTPRMKWWGGMGRLASSLLHLMCDPGVPLISTEDVPDCRQRLIHSIHHWSNPLAVRVWIMKFQLSESNSFSRSSLRKILDHLCIAHAEASSCIAATLSRLIFL